MLNKTFTDMIGHPVTVPYPPRRIVSLVPSQTELLHDLGLEDEVVGITKFCVHPEEWFRNKKRIGGTKTVHIDVVKQLEPDLVIANKEENTKQQVDELTALYPTWTSDIKTIQDGLRMILELGELTGKAEQARQLADDIADGFRLLKKAATPKRVAYFIWRKPWMCAGGDTFISDMIRAIGWENALADLDRYPEIELDALKERNIDLILLSSEPYPFKDAHVAELQASMPGAKALLVDGEMFSWYGSRMKQAIGYMKKLIETV